MRLIENHALAAVASTLTVDAVHVWCFEYRREQRRAPLLDVLGAYLGIEGAEVALVEGDFGRPELSPRHGMTLDFNWSHSGERALIAVAQGVAPGVDIERVQERPRAVQIADRYFLPAETAALSALDGAARSAAFLQLWTAKEAILKALGRGIAFGLDRLEIGGSQQQPTLLRLDGEDPGQWQLRRLDVGVGYLGALAWRGTSRVIDCQFLGASPQDSAGGNLASAGVRYP